MTVVYIVYTTPSQVKDFLEFCKDSLMENEVPGAYAPAHGGHGCLKSKENYVTTKDASKRAISRIIGDSLNGEDPGNFNEIVREERSKAMEGVKRIKLMGKENESTECQQNLPEPPLSIVPAASSSFNSHVPNWNFFRSRSIFCPF